MFLNIAKLPWQVCPVLKKDNKFCHGKKKLEHQSCHVLKQKCNCHGNFQKRHNTNVAVMETPKLQVGMAKHTLKLWLTWPSFFVIEFSMRPDTNLPRYEQIP